MKTQSDPLPALLMTLTVTTGLVDAISVLGLGRVFTANMTGNIVFLGFAAAGAPDFSVARCSIALGGFLLGALLGGRIGAGMMHSSRRRWLLTVAILESGLLFVSASIAQGYEMNAAASSSSLYGLIALTAVAMGLRNATVRRMGVPDLTTTVLTLTLTGMAADSSLAGGSNPRFLRRLGSVLAIFAGSALGVALLSVGGLALPLLVSGAMILLVTLAYAASAASREPVTTTS